MNGNATHLNISRPKAIERLARRNSRNIEVISIKNTSLRRGKEPRIIVKFGWGNNWIEVRVVSSVGDADFLKHADIDLIVANKVKN